MFFTIMLGNSVSCLFSTDLSPKLDICYLNVNISCKISALFAVTFCHIHQIWETSALYAWNINETCHLLQVSEDRIEFTLQNFLKKECNIVNCMATVITQTYWIFHILMYHFGVMYIVVFYLIMPVFTLQVILHKYGS